MGKILRQVTVVRDGMHNGFTDLAWWQNCHWVSYRKGTHHASIDGEVTVACAVDRTRFREVARIKMPGDNRDPKLVPIDDDRLAVIFPSWLGGHLRRDLRQYICFSADGFNWDAPRQILGVNQWLWRVRRHDGIWYGLIEYVGTRENPRAYHLEIVTSTDLLNWQTLCRVGRPEHQLNEADITFRPDGEAWIVARGSRQPDYAYFASAKPPYTQWEVSDLNAMVHCPAILEHEGAVYVTGRARTAIEGDPAWAFLSDSSLGVWRLERGHVVPVLRIPATGDCAYPGFIKDGDGRICLSYYSQHAYHMGVVPPPFRLLDTEPHDQGQLLTPDDVYFAELRLP